MSSSGAPGINNSRGSNINSNINETAQLIISKNNNNKDPTNAANRNSGSSSSSSSGDPFQDNFLWNVCGVVGDTPSVLCGESMLSKVTHLFGAATGSAAAAEDQHKAADNQDHSTTTTTTSTTTNTQPKAVTSTAHNNKGKNEILADHEHEQTARNDRHHNVGQASDHEPKKPHKKTKKAEGASAGDNDNDHHNHGKVAAISPKSRPKKKKSIKKDAAGEGGENDKSPKSKSPKTKKKRDTMKKKQISRNEDDASESSPAASSSLKSGGGGDHLDDDNLDEDDVDAMLKNLEIPDFKMSMDELPSPDQLDEPVDNSHGTTKPLQTVNWKERMTREEVYSKRYRPTRAETQELHHMADVLGLSKSTDLFGLGKRMGMTSKTTEDAHTLFFGDHSIILSVLPVKWDGTACELVLLTDGFVLKYRTSVNSYNPLEKRYETCQLWDSVEFCERPSPFAVAIQINASTRYEIETADEDEGGASLDWIFKCLERVITQHDLHDSNNPDRTDVLGWQYLRIRKPAFTAAVTNNPKFLLLLSSAKLETITRGINRLDSYNQYAPLHYAILQEECNPEVIQALLKAGADPNVLDGDERSAMYYAERNELPEEVMGILQGGGGQKSKLAEMEMRGELFRGVEGANQKAEQRRERDRLIKENEQAIKDQKAAEAAAKAEGAQSEMSKAMAALIERGEKIEQIDQKTKDLEAEAKTFGDLAARLKDEVKNKKWYQL